MCRLSGCCIRIILCSLDIPSLLVHDYETGLDDFDLLCLRGACLDLHVSIQLYTSQMAGPI